MMTSCEVTEAELQKLYNLHVPNRELERLVLLRQCACLDTGADESFVASLKSAQDFLRFRLFSQLLKFMLICSAGSCRGHLNERCRYTMVQV